MNVWAIKVISGHANKESFMYGIYGISQSIYDEKRKEIPMDQDIAYSYGSFWRQDDPPPRNYFNVYDFKITAWYQKGCYLVVKVNYPGAKHYEGNKVLVYDGITIDDLKDLKALDPHFLENKEKPTPIARFEPTEVGWIYAQKFCNMLHAERLELSY
jgi:hypothetical protein